MKKWITAWNEYWFAPQPLHGLALFRFTLGILIFYYYLVRLPYVEMGYSTESFYYPMSFFSRWGWPVFSPEIARWLMLGCVAAAAFYAVGLCTKICNLILVGLVIYFGALESSYTAGFFNLLLISAILMLFAPAGRFGSVDYWLWCRRHPRQNPKVRQTGNLWAIRLIVVQLALVYLGSAFYKSVYSPGWYTGEHLRQTFLCPHFGQMPFGLWLADFSWIFPFGGTLSLLFEFSMPLMLLTPQYRGAAVIAGTLFHLLIIFTFNITPLFSLTMVAHYILVAPPEWWKRWFEKIGQTLFAPSAAPLAVAGNKKLKRSRA